MSLGEVHVPMNASLGVVYIFIIGVTESAPVVAVIRRRVGQGFDELIEIA
jgi:hypothetical protein